LFDAWSVASVRQAVTEGNNRPDFLFPSAEACHTACIGDPGLMMLGAKSICKERWRQVLPEAGKILRKHLLALESGISEPQTEQMKTARVQLVIPQQIHESYRPVQDEWLMNLREFIELVKSVLMQQ